MPSQPNPRPSEPAAPSAVVIVGRPNVGKSALFNRIAGRRIAIVHEESGVTRDRIAARVHGHARPFDLVDTGGIFGRHMHGTPDLIQQGIARQTDEALREAAAIVFVVDAAAGPAPLDASVAAQLHRHGRPVVLAANKCDDERQDERAGEFARFGFPVVPVSALHNRGIDQLIGEILAHLPPAADAAPAEPGEPLRIAIVGRPNVGKSSFINRILRADRVIVSEIPGTTRDSIDVPFSIGGGPRARRYVLTDTAGLRAKRKVDSAVEKFSLIRAEESIARAGVCVLLLDGAQGPTAQDKKIADLIFEYRKGCILAVNKWDLLADVSTPREYEEALRRAVPFLDFVPVIFVSALSGYNIRQVLDTVNAVAANMAAKLPTGPLNRVIEEAYARVPPPIAHGRRLKIFYAVQTGTCPQRVTLFVNEPPLFPANYGIYLAVAVRRRFGLVGAPVVFTTRERPGQKDRPFLRNRNN